MKKRNASTLFISILLLSILLLSVSLTGCQKSSSEVSVSEVNKHKDSGIIADTSQPTEETPVEVVTKTGPYGELSLIVPEGWRISPAQRGENDFVGLYGFVLTPNNVKKGRIEVSYYKDFGVCGTELEIKNVTLSGEKAEQGFYDGNDKWTYIAFGQGSLHHVVVQNFDAFDWDEEYYKQLEYILNNIKLNPDKTEGGAFEFTKEAENDVYELNMSLENITNTSATLVLNQHDNGKEGMYGAEYIIEYLDGKKWVEMPVNKEIGWKDIGYIIKPGEFKTEIDWSDLYGSLKPGTYRLKKNFHYDTNFSLYAQFVIG